MADAPHLEAGTYWVDGACPRCRARTPIPLALSTVLTVDDDGSVLKIKAKSTTAPHDCRAGTISLIVRDGD